MSLTDERIFEILKSIEPCSVRLPLGWKLFAKAIEQEVTKPQEPITVTCQIYGHVVGVCDECNTHAEKDVHDTNKILADNYLKMTCGEPQPCPLCNSAELEAELLNKEGMTCGDCNDTGWLENREDGRYPCTCMTEAEPYQLLEAERDALAIQNQQMRSIIDKFINGITDSICASGNDAGTNIWYVRKLKSEIALPDLSAEVIKRHDADKKDAERYQHLRSDIRWVVQTRHNENEYSDGPLDAAIDAEIGAQL